MGVILVGANPGVRLFDGDRLAAFASVWQVDWSEHGSGRVLVLWRDGTVRVLTTEADLGRWLERHFTRHFPEADGLTWPEPTPVVAEVQIDLDLASGFTARADNVEVTMEGPLDRCTFTTDNFDLGGVAHGLQNVLVPMRSASVTVAGEKIRGEVIVGGAPARPTSTGFLAVAEVWTRPD